MNKAKIIVLKGNLDINGNRKYTYNFIDSNSINQNYEFGLYGRKTEKGLSSQIEPTILKKSLLEFGKWLNLQVGVDMGKAQKAIDKCNSKSGCNSCCGIARQKECTLLKEHNSCVERLTIVQEFLEKDVKIIEVREKEKLKVISSLCLVNNASLNIYDIVYGVDDYVIAEINDYTPRKYKIYETNKGSYFNYGGKRFYLEEFTKW